VNEAMPQVLLADDQPDVLEALSLLLKMEKMRAVTVTSPAAVLQRVEREELDAALIDLNYTRDTTSGAEGMSLLERIAEIDPSLPVVVMTAWGSIAGAVEAMRRGARDYVEKPWDNGRLVATLRSQVELGRALRTSRRLEQETSRQRERQLPELVAEARTMQAVIRLLERVAPSDANVLVGGEHGTGKEVVARWIHAASERAKRPFVAVNAGGLADGVFESELFGHVRGAFTDAKADRVGCFELAHGGTLFLDELGNMPPAQQAKLLRVLQTGEFHPVGSSRVRKCDVRVVSATNVDLGREVRAGKFREDLLYRLNTVEIHLPPLRERREDIPVLATAFLRREQERRARPALAFSPGAMHTLLEHRWPGNVRELEHVVERAVLLAHGPEIGAEDLLLRARPGEVHREPDETVVTLEESEKQCILRALAHARGNVVDAARHLGVSRSALYRRLQHYGIKAPG